MFVNKEKVVSLPSNTAMKCLSAGGGVTFVGE